MPYAPVNDINMYYEEFGSGEPLILLHGALGSLLEPDYSWLELMPIFAKHYRTIHIEHRGHGRTNNPANFYNYAVIADDLSRFIESTGLAQTHLAGLSDGAISIMQLAMTRPELVSSLICVGANYHNDDLVVEANRFADLKEIEKDPSEVHRLSRLHDQNKEPGYWRELVRQTAKNLAINPQYALSDLASITAPTLLLSGQNDLWANLNQMLAMKQAIKNSEIMIIDHAEHNIQHTHPQIVGPAILDFLSRNRLERTQNNNILQNIDTQHQ